MSKKPDVVKSPKSTSIEDFTGPAFSQKNLTNSVTDEYEHPLVTVEPSELQIEKARLAAEAEAAAEEEAAKKAAEEAKKKKKKSERVSSVSSDIEEDKTQPEADEEFQSQDDDKDQDDQEDDDDEYCYRVFFRKDEIKTAKIRQN